MKNTKMIVFLSTFISMVGINAQSLDETIKHSIDEASDSLKAIIDECKDNYVRVQDYLDDKWNHLVQEVALYDALTLKHLQLNGHSRVVVVEPGQKIKGSVVCSLDKSKCDPLTFYRVVLGVEDQKAQTTIGNEFGVFAGESLEKFTLVAPCEPGIYLLRFKLVQSLWEKTAMHSWEEEAPDVTKTIGIIVVASN